jgi:hypothetical protein
MGARLSFMPAAIALAPALLTASTLLAAWSGASLLLQAVLGTLALLVATALLMHIFRLTLKSEHRGALRYARLHILLHVVPALLLAFYLGGPPPAPARLFLVLSLVCFFYTGTQTWRALAAIFPSTLLYRLFSRGNSAFLTSFPLLYLGTLVFSDTISFGLVWKVALFYFSIHFMLLGAATLKIESDLSSA